MIHTPLLQVRGVSKWYGGIHALDNVSLEIDRGEILAVVGDNGAGKSTLLKIIAGAIQSNDGEILIDGEPVKFKSPREARQHRIETVYQDLALIETFDIPANFFIGKEPTFGGWLRPLKIMRLREMRQKALEAILNLHVKIPGTHSKVVEMSGGQRQAVATARAAFWKSKVLLLDEPTAALGHEEAHEVMRLLKMLATEQQMAMLVISHNLQHVWTLCDKILVLRQGRQVATLCKYETTTEEVVGFITGARVTD